MLCEALMGLSPWAQARPSRAGVTMEPMPAASPAVLRKSRRVDRARWGNSAMIDPPGSRSQVDGSGCDKPGRTLHGRCSACQPDERAKLLDRKGFLGLSCSDGRAPFLPHSRPSESVAVIRSMTGYGRAEAANERLGLAVEVKSVNHRHLDIAVKLPRAITS